jgi:hypothetical protein
MFVIKYQNFTFSPSKWCFNYMLPKHVNIVCILLTLCTVCCIRFSNQTAVSLNNFKSLIFRINTRCVSCCVGDDYNNNSKWFAELLIFLPTSRSSDVPTKSKFSTAFGLCMNVKLYYWNMDFKFSSIFHTFVLVLIILSLTHAHSAANWSYTHINSFSPSIPSSVLCNLFSHLHLTL